jgi:hypothetical protein
MKVYLLDQMPCCAGESGIEGDLPVLAWPTQSE